MAFYPNQAGITMELPKVLPDDNGIRPAGQPDECFYCKQKVGTPHLMDCVILEKKVKLKVLIEIERYEPYGWTKEQIEFARNWSSWCASNIMEDIQRHNDQCEERGECLCPSVEIQVLDMDTEVVRRNDKDDIVP